MDEEAIYSDIDVIVTPTRILAGNETFAISGITSVRREAKNVNGLELGFCIVIGLLAMLIGPLFVKALGFAGVAYCAFVLRKQLGTEAIVLVTAAGEQKAFQSRSPDQVARICAAIDEAIIRRAD